MSPHYPKGMILCFDSHHVPHSSSALVEEPWSEDLPLAAPQTECSPTHQPVFHQFTDFCYISINSTVFDEVLLISQVEILNPQDMFAYLADEIYLWRLASLSRELNFLSPLTKPAEVLTTSSLRNYHYCDDHDDDHGDDHGDHVDLADKACRGAHHKLLLELLLLWWLWLWWWSWWWSWRWCWSCWQGLLRCSPPSPDQKKRLFV